MTPGTLRENESHPAVNSAIEYFNSLSLEKIILYQESFASCSIADNRLAEICSETLNRLITKQPVSDRYFLGLVWTIRNMERTENK